MVVPRGSLQCGYPAYARWHCFVGASAGTPTTMFQVELVEIVFCNGFIDRRQKFKPVIHESKWSAIGNRAANVQKRYTTSQRALLM